MSFSFALVYLVLLFIPTASQASVYYQYDARHRLISEIFDSGVGMTYSYDDVGNRTEKTVTSTATPNNPPNVPAAVSPIDNETDVGVIGLQLQWSGGDPDPDSTVRYSVYFGESNPPALLQNNLTATAVNLPQLVPGTTYYWQVISRDQYYMTAESPVWSFSTDPVPPHPPITPIPENNTTVSYNSRTLSWDVDAEPEKTFTYTLRFGTTTTPPVLVDALTQKSYLVGTLVPGRQYYWQVVATDDEGLASTGPLWSFTTESSGTATFSNPVFSTNTVLTASGGPYLISGQMTIGSGASLIIEPGAIFKMQSGSSIKVDGTLLALGAESEKIIFTSSRNDLAGGDTNQDGDTTVPAPGDWVGFLFSGSATAASTLSHCIVEYAGANNYGAIRVQGSSPNFANTLIRHNKYYGIHIQGGSPVIDNNTISSNGNYGIYVASGTPYVRNNSVSDGIYVQGTGLAQLSNNSFILSDTLPLHVSADFVGDLFSANSISTGDGSGYIEVVGGTITKDATWKGGIPLHISGSVTVQGTDGDDDITTLTLEPGTILKFASANQLVIGGTSGDPGALVASGLADNKILFTTSVASPAPGTWYGVTFQTTTATTSVMDHCIVEYAGYGNYAGIKINSSSPAIKNTELRNNKYYGIHVSYGSALLDGNTIHDSGYYGLYVQAGTPAITNNVIHDGVYITSPGVISLNGNTFPVSTVKPFYIPAENVGELLSANIISNISSADFIKVAGGTITKDATWKAILPLQMQSSITIQGTDGEDDVTTLTIEPGAALRFGTGMQFLVGNTSGNPGALNATGTPEQPITMTSSAATPAPGNWYGMTFSTTADGSSRLEHCIVEYAGYGNYGAVRIQSSSPTISNVVVRKNTYYGIHVLSGSPILSNSTVSESGYVGIYVQNGTPVVDRNTIADTGTGYGVYLGAGTTVLTNNSISDGIFTANNTVSQLTSNTFSLNGNQRLRIPVDFMGDLFNRNSLSDITGDSVIEVVSGAVTRDATWRSTVPLVMLGNITVQGTDGDDNLTTLTIEPGAVLRFGNYQQFIIGGTSGAPGALHAVGTTENPITFTSSAAVPAPGNWYGITFYPTTDDGSIMDHCIVEYAGYGNYGALRIQDSAPTITNATIRNNKYFGIHILSGAPTISNSVISDNGYHGIYVQNGTPLIDNNTINNSGNYSIYIGAGQPVVTNNTVTDGIFVPNNGIAHLGGNTISLDGDQPLRIPADFIGELFAENTLSNVTEDSFLEVVGGTVTKDATWKDTVPLHILGSITVKGTDGDDSLTSLTLEPGTMLKFGPYQQLIIGGTSGDPGALQALGTSEKKILFTTSHATPAPGKWYGILFYSTAAESSTMDNCIVEYAGYGNYPAIYTYSSSPTISNTAIHNNQYYGISNSNGSPVISGNEITGNGYYAVYSNAGAITLTDNHLDGGISLPNDGLTAISGNIFDYTQGRAVRVPVDWVGDLTSDNSFINTNSNSVVEVIAGTVARDALWKDKLPLQILGSITVKGTDGDDFLTTLSLDPGVELRFNRNIQFVIGGTSGDPGALVAVGTAEKRILFTSSEAAPAAGNWYGILLYTTSADTSILDHCTVEYGGYSNYGGVYNYGASATIANSTLRYNQAYGVRVYTGSPIIRDSIFIENGIHAIYSQSATPLISGNSFVTPANCGVTNATSSITVLAENNWWGHESGPLDSSDDTATGGLYNPAGLGACVSNYVDYLPWATTSLIDSDGDGISDDLETGTYGTDPLLFDTDGDGIGDGDELAYWGSAWNSDNDNDGLINLLDIDADGDGTSDGDEIAQGTNPGGSTPPATITYEDAEDGLIAGWQVYDNDPTGAFVDNVYDADKGDRVIELTGDGLQNGFRLFDDQENNWNNTSHQIIEWSMNYNEDYVISIAVQTTTGLRYLSYTPDNDDALGSGTDIFHGLGASSKDGTWRTYVIDLGYHLNEAQPGNTITSLLAFYVSGNGRIDDIKTHQTIPAGWDSDGDGLTDNYEVLIYGTHPYSADSDGDGIADGAELTYWGSAWNTDHDSDGLINILDIDSDNNGVIDGM
jgi:YD repeat-containing protein/parallel beta-helix repeat protein